MNILIDTHIALWSMYDDSRLNKHSRELLANENNTILVSHVSAWEIALKSSIGKLSIPTSEFLNDSAAMGFRELPLRKQHIINLPNIPAGSDGHKDPFDRMLIAQADSEGIKFLSEDSKILKYEISAIIKNSEL